MSKLNEPRSLHDLRRAAFNSKIEKDARAILATVDACHAMRKRLELPSNIYAVGLEYWGVSKPEQLGPGERAFFESFAIAHDKQNLAKFSEAYIGGRIQGQDYVPVIRAYNARLAQLLEDELLVVTAWLHVAYDAMNCGHLVETAQPVAELREQLHRTKLAIESGAGGEHGLRSMLSYLNK